MYNLFFIKDINATKDIKDTFSIKQKQPFLVCTKIRDLFDEMSVNWQTLHKN